MKPGISSAVEASKHLTPRRAVQRLLAAGVRAARIMDLPGGAVGMAGLKAVDARAQLTVAKGATVGVIGLNGAGQSTIMRAIYGFVPPRRGQIFIDGEDVTRVPEYAMLARHQPVTWRRAYHGSPSLMSSRRFAT